MESEADGLDQKEKKSQVAEAAPHPLAGVAGVVPQGVSDTSENPHETSDGGPDGRIQATDQKQKEKLRIIFERVLMRTLDAVEDGIFVRIHRGVGNLKLLASFAHLDSLPHHHEDRSNGCE